MGIPLSLQLTFVSRYSVTIDTVALLLYAGVNVTTSVEHGLMLMVLVSCHFRLP